MPITHIRIALLLIFCAINTPAYSQPSLETLITESEKKHAKEIADFSKAISEQTQSANPKYEQYGGELGNRYFQYYTNEIIIPVLTEYIKSLKSSKENQEEVFIQMLDVLGKIRQKIAENTHSQDASSYGQKTNTWSETISSDTNDPSTLDWLKYLQQYFGLATIDFTKLPTLQDVLNTIEQNILVKANTNLVVSNKKIFLRLRNGANVYVGSYSIEPISDPKSTNPFEGFTPDIKLYDKNNIQFTFFHTIALTKYLAKLFFTSLTPTLSSDQLLEALGRFLYYWSQAAVFARGQSAVGEWIIGAIAGSAGYKLVFSRAWKGRNKATMEPAMYAQSYLDEKEFIEKFMANASLQK